MVEIGKEIRRTLQMGPPRFWVRADRYYTYACKHCEQETGEAVMETTPMELALVRLSASSVPFFDYSRKSYRVPCSIWYYLVLCGTT